MKRSERGSNLVEFALVAPVLVFLLIGIADVGRAFYDYISITNAVREGARYATRHPLDPANANIIRKDTCRDQQLRPFPDVHPPKVDPSERTQQERRNA